MGKFFKTAAAEPELTTEQALAQLDQIDIRDTTLLTRILSAPMRYLSKLLFFSPKMAVGSVSQFSPETIAEVRRLAKQDPTLKVYIGHSPVVDQVKRALEGKGMSFSHLLLRPIGALSSAEAGVAGKLFGGDYYNPAAHAVSIRSNFSSVGAHELGHGDDYKKSKYPTIKHLAYHIPPFSIFQEDAASTWAGENLEHDRESLKVLTPAMGGYLGSLVRYPVVGMVSGHLVKNHRYYGKEKDDAIKEQQRIERLAALKNNRNI